MTKHLKVAQEGHADCAKLLLAHGAKVNQLVNVSVGAEQQLPSSTSINVLITCWTSCMHQDKLVCVACMLHGETPLLMATWYGQKEIAKLLLTYGAKVDQPNNVSGAEAAT